MPNRIGHPCAAPGCGAVVTVRRYCAQHTRPHGSDGTRTPEAELKRDPAVRKLYNSTRWKKYSKAFLARHPWCADPFMIHEGRLAPSQQTDHIIAHKGDVILFWDKQNHQALCTSCGGRKSAVEVGGRAHSTARVIAPVSGVVGVK